MLLFDFHHHYFNSVSGIYNLGCGEELPPALFSAGIHPSETAENMEEKFRWLKEVSKNDKCVAIGECGLDGIIKPDRQIQEEVFVKQIEWANEIKKPLIIHCVKMFSDLIRLKKKANVPMIVHGFNKRKTIGLELLKNDFFLSFGKSALYNVNLQDFLSEVPTEKLFLETDTADFDLRELYELTARLKNTTPEELSKKIKDNLEFLKITI
ncbi:TatD family hydrolase [Chryseobacterium sp.]|uniref:TatD family hydrolase n=1 Tax=Chryseobacterium sp. TaxID=1871047 RepID=UPI0011CBD1C6|nr:TatD family hydrolase [Chryseobacterium sp.]TXF75891.1 TatD family deoxyribonuclease [Chryseobacterium sp.]